MSTFKAYFKKEVIESIRQYRYIALATGVILFSFLDPIMLKLLPIFLNQKMPKALFDQIFKVTPHYAFTNYLKDLYQIGILFVVFSVAGSINEEIYSYKIVFPLSKGARRSSIFLAKLSHFTIAVWMFLFIGFLTNFYYVNSLFKVNKVSFLQMAWAFIMFCIYFLFAIVLTLLFSSFTKKNITAGFISCIVNYSLSLTSQLRTVSKFLPYNLISLSNDFNNSNALISIFSTLALCFLLSLFTIRRINNLEIK